MGKTYCKYCAFKLCDEFAIEYCLKCPTYDYTYDEKSVDYVEECRDINEDNNCKLFELGMRGRILRRLKIKREEIPSTLPKRKKVKTTKSVDNRFEIMDI